MVGAIIHAEEFEVLRARTPQEKLLRVADRYRAPMMRMLYEAIKASREQIDVVNLEMLFSFGLQEPIVKYLEGFLLYQETPFRIASSSRASKLFLKIAEDAGNATRCDFTAECLQEFDVHNPEAVAWAEKHAAELVAEVSEESRRAIRRIVARAFTDKMPPRQSAKLIRNVVGLTEVQADAVINLQQKVLTSPGSLIYAGKTPIRVPKAGMPEARLDGIIQKYADRLTRHRAMTIARTETMMASNQGQALLWSQAQARGELPRTLKHEWIASFSERTCPICSALNGEVVEVGKPFSAGVTNPPAHPSCRCTTGLV